VQDGVRWSQYGDWAVQRSSRTSQWSGSRNGPGVRLHPAGLPRGPLLALVRTVMKCGSFQGPYSGPRERSNRREEGGSTEAEVTEPAFRVSSPRLLSESAHAPSPSQVK
jgi:hypothetical protein